MHNVYSKLRLLSILLLGWLVVFSLCGTANAKITGNALFSYDLIKENGEWSGEFEQRINLGLRGSAGLGGLLGLNVGLIRRGKEWSFLGGLTPTYALNLRGEHYDFSSGYSVRMYRDIVSSRLYENLSLFLPDLPTFGLVYAKQGTRDTLEEHRTNSTGSNMQFRVEDEIGPFRIRLNRQEYTSENLVRGPKYDVKSSNNSGNVDYSYSYRRLFSLNGRYGISQLSTEQILTGETKARTQDFSLGFRISPIPTIALSGTTAGRRERREGLMKQGSLSARNNDSSSNRLQLMLQPIKGVLLNTAYSRSDAFRNVEEPFSNESKSITVSLEPREDLTFSGHFMTYDSQEQEKRISTLKRSSFDVRAEPIMGLLVSSRLSQSKSTNFSSELRSDRDSVTTKLEAMLTRSFRTDISYDWERAKKRSEDAIDRDIQHRLALAGNYSFARMLDLNFRFSKSISSAWEGSTTLSAFGLSYTKYESHASIRYNRSSNPGRSTSLSGQQQWTTQSFILSLDQEVGRDVDLSLNYENQLGKRQFDRRGTKRISFRANIRF